LCGVQYDLGIDALQITPRIRSMQEAFHSGVHQIYRGDHRARQCWWGKRFSRDPIHPFRIYRNRTLCGFCVHCGCVLWETYEQQFNGSIFEILKSWVCLGIDPDFGSEVTFTSKRAKKGVSPRPLAILPRTQDLLISLRIRLALSFLRARHLLPSRYGYMCRDKLPCR